jgi:hypothetical protein
MRSRLCKHHSTRGFALIALLAILTAGILYFVVGQLDATTVQRKRDDATTETLAQAKQALIARATTEANRPGSLPCPALNSNGVAPLFVGNDCQTYNGLLPWRTLGVGELRDGFSAIPGYQLASQLRDHPSAEPINTTTSFSVSGLANVAAIVVATGNRTNSISRNELFAGVVRRVAREIRGGLAAYFSTSGATLPCAAPTLAGSPQAGLLSGFVPYSDPGFSLAPTTQTWLTNNQWFGTVQYTVISCSPNPSTSATISVGSYTVPFGFP